MTEAQLQSAVIELARRLGYRCAHTPRARAGAERWLTPTAADAKGEPDLRLVRGGSHPRVVFVECKSNRGTLGPAQKVWRDLLIEVEAFAEGVVSYHVFRPRDWLAGRVEEVLK